MPKDDLVIPPVRYRSAKKPLLKRMAHPFKAPFTDTLGGPNLDECTLHEIDCGLLDIELFRPLAAMGARDGYPRKVDLRDDATFERNNIDERTQHQFKKLAGSNWGYAPPRLSPTRFLPIPQEPYVIVTAYWNLERVKNGIQLEVGNTEMLEQYLRDDYYAFLESEGGYNWRARKEENEVLGPQGRGWPQRLIDESIANRLYTPPRNYEPLVFNGQPWLRYNWAPMQNYPEGLMFTTVLTPNTLFTVYFNLTQMIGGSIKHWWSELVEDTEILMQGVKVHYKDLPPGADSETRLPG